MITQIATPLLAIAMAATLLIVAGPISAQDYTAEPGEIVLLRQVTPTPINRPTRYEGPIMSSVNMRRKVDLSPLDKLEGNELTDAEAAIVRGAPAPGNRVREVAGSNGHMNDGTGTNEELISGPASVNGQLMQTLEGGMSGAIGEQTTDLKKQIGKALGPLK